MGDMIKRLLGGYASVGRFILIGAGLVAFSGLAALAIVTPLWYLATTSPGAYAGLAIALLAVLLIVALTLAWRRRRKEGFKAAEIARGWLLVCAKAVLGLAFILLLLASIVLVSSGKLPFAIAIWIATPPLAALAFRRKSPGR